MRNKSLKYVYYTADPENVFKDTKINTDCLTGIESEVLKQTLLNFRW